MLFIGINLTILALNALLVLIAFYIYKIKIKEDLKNYLDKHLDKRCEGIRHLYNRSMDDISNSTFDKFIPLVSQRINQQLDYVKTAAERKIKDHIDETVNNEIKAIKEFFKNKEGELQLSIYEQMDTVSAYLISKNNVKTEPPKSKTTIKPKKLKKRGKQNEKKEKR